MTACFLPLRFERLFLTSISDLLTVSKLFAPVSWLLVAAVLPVTPPPRVATSTALLLRVFSPVFTPLRAPPSPSPHPARRR